MTQNGSPWVAGAQRQFVPVLAESRCPGALLLKLWTFVISESVTVCLQQDKQLVPECKLIKKVLLQKIT